MYDNAQQRVAAVAPLRSATRLNPTVSAQGEIGIDKI